MTESERVNLLMEFCLMAAQNHAEVATFCDVTAAGWEAVPNHGLALNYKIASNVERHASGRWYKMAQRLRSQEPHLYASNAELLESLRMSTEPAASGGGDS